MDMLKSILECFTSISSNDGNAKSSNHATASEEEQLANEIVNVLLTADTSSTVEEQVMQMKMKLDNVVHTEGLKQRFAKRILSHLVNALNAGKAMGKAMKPAFDKATKAANEFVEKHPVYAAVVATVVAILVLVLLVPWVVEALGFGTEGPIADSFAAWWQSTFPDVEADSFFAWLQSLGMR